MANKLRIWISAGETSGDERGSEFLTALTEMSDYDAIGIAGPRLRAQGVQTIRRMEDLQGFGIAEVIRHIPGTFRILQQSVRTCKRERPDAAVLVDYGEFHMRLGRQLRRLGIPVLHIAPPKLWAWADWRVRRLARSADLLGVLFPFEKTWYERRGFDVVAIGHPVCRLLETPANDDADRLLILPGSRPSELDRHLGLFIQSAVGVADQLGLRPVLCVAPGMELRARQVPEPTIEIRNVNNCESYRDGALALAASGTVNLELAAMGVPQVVCYRTSSLTYLAGNALVGLNWINPVNINAGRPVIPELLQKQANVGQIQQALQMVFSDRDSRIAAARSVVASLARPDGMSQAASDLLALVA